MSVLFLQFKRTEIIERVCRTLLLLIAVIFIDTLSNVWNNSVAGAIGCYHYHDIQFNSNIVCTDGNPVSLQRIFPRAIQNYFLF